MPHGARVETQWVYDLLNSSGMRCVLKSFVNWYIVSMLYRQPQGMTSTMIYEAYRKTPFDPRLAAELRESRSCIIVHLNELEGEGIVQKGLFKQYVLTEKGRSICENILKMTREVKVEEKERAEEKVIVLPPQVIVEAPAPLKKPKKEKEKEVKPRIKEIEEVKKARIGIKRT